LLRLPRGFNAFYRAALPLSRTPLDYPAGVFRRHRRKIGSCWRKLKPGRQALLVLAHLRTGETFAALAAGFGIGTATAWRYVQETVALLAARAPKLDAALRSAGPRGHAFVVIDGDAHPPSTEWRPTGRSTPANTAKHGMNLQVIVSPQGGILCGSPGVAQCRPRPDRREDLGHRAPPG